METRIKAPHWPELTIWLQRAGFAVAGLAEGYSVLAGVNGTVLAAHSTNRGVPFTLSF